MVTVSLCQKNSLNLKLGTQLLLNWKCVSFHSFCSLCLLLSLFTYCMKNGFLFFPDVFSLLPCYQPYFNVINLVGMWKRQSQSLNVCDSHSLHVFSLIVKPHAPNFVQLCFCLENVVMTALRKDTHLVLYLNLIVSVMYNIIRQC